MTDYKQDFIKFIYETNVDGSNKAPSYVQALDWLNKMIEVEPFSFKDCKNIWQVNSVDRLHELYLFVLGESKKKDKSSWSIHGIPKSYLQKGYCSAALKSYQSFLVEYNYENTLLKIFDQNKEEMPGLFEKIETEINYPDYLLDGLEGKQGEDVVRSVRVRSNQYVFRKIIFKLYNQSCCITGLNLPEINRASHIIPWAADSTKRLDPRNGLCLSATYDAAFDVRLISLDDDYRIILSKGIKNFYSSESVKEYFYKKEGKRISLPSLYLPHKDYLEKHRSKGDF